MNGYEINVAKLLYLADWVLAQGKLYSKFKVIKTLWHHTLKIKLPHMKSVENGLFMYNWSYIADV